MNAEEARRQAMKRPCRCQCGCRDLTLYGRCNPCLTGEHLARRRRDAERAERPLAPGEAQELYGR